MQTEPETGALTHFKGAVSTLLIGAILCCAWLVPNHYNPWPMFYNEFLAWVALLALAWSVARTNKADIKVPASASVVCGLALLCLAQWLFGTIFFFGDALIALLYLVGLGLAIVVGLRVASDTRFCAWLAWSILTAAGISFVLALSQLLGIRLFGPWLVDLARDNVAPYANLAQQNLLASLFCMGLISAIYLRERGSLQRHGMVFLALLFFVGMAMTRSRMIILSVLVTAIWLLVGKRSLPMKITVPEIVFGTVLFVALWLCWPTLLAMFDIRLEASSTKLLRAMSDLRLSFWKQLLAASLEKPIFGWGWNQVSVAQLSVAELYPPSLFTEHAHNLFVDILIWSGLVVGVPVILLICWWMANRWRRISHIHTWYAMAIVVVLGVHSMLEFPLEYAFFLIPFGLCVGIVDAGVSGSGVLRIPRRAFMAILGLGAAIAIIIFGEYRTIENDYRRLRFEAAGIEQRNPSHMAPDVVLLTQLREFLRFARTEAREGMSESEMDWMRQVSSRYAYPPSMFRYALALGLNGKYGEASLQLLRLRQLHSPLRYQEAREAWDELEKKYPQLEKVEFPAPEI